MGNKRLIPLDAKQPSAKPQVVAGLPKRSQILVIVSEATAHLHVQPGGKVSFSTACFGVFSLLQPDWDIAPKRRRGLGESQPLRKSDVQLDKLTGVSKARRGIKDLESPHRIGFDPMALSTSR